MRRTWMIGSSLLASLIAVGCASPGEDDAASGASAIGRPGEPAQNGEFTTYFQPYRDTSPSNASTLGFAMELDQLIMHGRSIDVTMDAPKAFAYSRNRDARILKNARGIARTVPVRDSNGQTHDVIMRNAVMFDGANMLDFVSGQGDDLRDEDPLTALIDNKLTIESEYTFKRPGGGDERWKCSLDAALPTIVRAVLLDEDFFKNVPPARPDEASDPAGAKRFDELNGNPNATPPVLGYLPALDNARKALKRSQQPSKADLEELAKFQGAHGIHADISVNYQSPGNVAVAGVHLLDVPASLQGRMLDVAGAKPWSDASMGGAGSCDYNASNKIAITVPDPNGNNVQRFRAASCGGTGEPDLELTGWSGSYFKNTSLSGEAADRDDAKIDFNWQNGSPGPGFPLDNFSARWTKSLNLQETTSYTVTATVDDGVRVKICKDPECRQVEATPIDKWQDQGATTFTADFALTPGKHTIVVEYYEHTGDAVAQISVKQKVGRASDAAERAALPLAKASNLRTFIKQTMIRADYAYECDKSPSSTCVAPRLEAVFQDSNGPRRFVGRIETNIMSGMTLSNLKCESR